uniref:Spermatogenesis associated 17 n=1 Tax=Chelydra serpentina TaxID=8475 RepID=A0A8C3T9N0_CHESE
RNHSQIPPVSDQELGALGGTQARPLLRVPAQAVDEYRKAEHNAAVRIQSWFRGCRVRAYIRYYDFFSILTPIFTYFIMKMNFYNEMAVRVNISSLVKQMKSQLCSEFAFNKMSKPEYINLIDMKELEEFAEMKEKEKEKRDLEREEKKKDHQARKMHYLLSTEQTAGVYNSPFRQSPDPMEIRLRKARPFSHRQQQIKKHLTDEISDWPACTSTLTFPTMKPLPPIGRQKPQGPFRDTAEVLQQRYKPLEPTLRVATSINSLEKAREEIKREEWRTRINDNKFLPFSSCHKNQEYDPLIHTSSKYGQMTYGIKHFREEHHEKWVANKNFETVLPSIDLFDKFGQTYSKAGQIV